jgi:hypothetical protein
MKTEKLTPEEVDTAEIGITIKAVNGKLKATRISFEKWAVVFASGLKATMHHSRIVPVIHSRYLSGKENSHVDHIGYVYA